VIVGRHRHAITIRTDGLETVLGPVLRDLRVRAAALVDVGSGMVLDGWSRESAGDPELVSAAAAELVRIAVGMLGSAEPEVVVCLGGSLHHVVRTVPDQCGSPLALSLIVEGPRRAVERTRRRLRRVPVAAVSAGPSMSRRPPDGTWSTWTTWTLPAVAEPERPPPTRHRHDGLWAVRRSASPGAPARPMPPSALPPAPRVP
jgi:hypothetical protein